MREEHSPCAANAGGADRCVEHVTAGGDIQGREPSEAASRDERGVRIKKCRVIEVWLSTTTDSPQRGSLTYTSKWARGELESLLG
ncbi:hypothetical protein BH11MYX1_BH11MYX1_57550 [soil metagenome]